jgi:hypothetical protein
MSSNRSCENHLASKFTDKDVKSLETLLRKAKANLLHEEVTQETVDNVYAMFAVMNDQSPSLQTMAAERQAELDGPRDCG